MKTISKLLTSAFLLLFVVVVNAQTIDVSLTINNDDDPLYTTTFYVYMEGSGIIYTETFTDIENGVTDFSLDYLVPDDTLLPIYTVYVSVSYSGITQYDHTPAVNTNQLYNYVFPLEVNF